MACSTRSLLHADHQKVTAKQRNVMAVAVKKYNPGFLTDEQIIESFCVRTSEFESIVESLREPASNSNTHTLVIGPRGSGKTHLLLRIAAETRQDDQLSGRILSVVFAEESYEVTTFGEFWLECLYHLSEQAPDGDRDGLRLTYNELRHVSDDRTLAERCLGSLLDFADRHRQRLLLIVENLNMLFADMGDADVGWQLRKILQTEPRIVLLGSATSRFDEIDHPDHALYDIFRVITLNPLETDECQKLWRTAAGNQSTPNAVRPLEILTGGNPRLLAIIATFGADQSLRELMGNVLDLVDDHTEYFKSHLDSLPPQERRVYLALARLWKPSTTKEISDQARIDTNRCSAFLKRLERRGVVTIAGGTARRTQYYLTERLYNIYYLLRRGGGADNLVKALIDFMICMYTPSTLIDIYESSRGDVPDLEKVFPDIGVHMAEALIHQAQSMDQTGSHDEAIHVYDQIICRFAREGSSKIENQVAVALMNKTLLLSRNDRPTGSN